MMKIFFYILWSLTILLFIICMLNVFGKDKVNESLMVDFNAKTLDSLFSASNHTIVVTVGSQDCDICNNFIKERVYLSLPYKKYYCNIETSVNNKLISQALFNTGFPISYIIDKEYNVKSIIQGRYKFLERIEQFYFLNDAVYNIEMDSINRDSIPKMLSWALKALTFYWKDNFNEMRNCTYESLLCGEYFFNNYLLYLFFEKKNEIDSLERYKTKLLKFNTPVNEFVYGDLINELRSNGSR